MKTHGKVINGWGPALRTLWVDQRANSLFLTAAAVLPIMGLVGSGVDIGRAYMAELRLQQACDAGVLAGRRAMTGSTYGSTAKAEANKMFNFNYPAGTYGSNTIVFTSQAQGASDVSGTASVQLPSTIMKVFNFDNFSLAVNCAAKLEISNVDIMLVLDVTGSMAQTNSGDSVNRITALKTATMDFFDTMTTADIGDGRMRFGVIPYSSSVNVGAILAAKDPSYLSDTILLPSRTPVFRVTWGDPTTTEDDDYIDGPTAYGNWSRVNGATPAPAASEAACNLVESPASTTPDSSGSPNYNQTAQYVDGDGNRVTTYDTEETYSFREYDWEWQASRSRCRLIQRTGTFDRTHTTTTTEVPTQAFDDEYVYQDRVFDVSGAKAGMAIVTDTGDEGASKSDMWDGCILERATIPYASNQALPSAAEDMDVDSAPTADDDSKWKVLIPQIAFARARHPFYAPANNGNSRTVAASDVSSETGTNGNWQNFSRYASSGWGACPAPALNLITQTASDRATFATYVDSLQPIGGTYHDAGMLWGIRLLSAEGIFATENATAPNGRPISRHIVFMTDGEMAPNLGNLSFQGYEYLMHRVGGNSDATLTDRHNNRFGQLCEIAKSKNITVWVVSFGVALNASLTNCASAGKAYQADNAAQLNDNFQSIARQISRLRLSL